MRAILFLAALCALSTRGAQARVVSYALELGPVKVDLPNTWQAAPGLFGIPLMLMGPKESGSRPIVYVIPLGANNTVFHPDKLKGGDPAYRVDTEERLKALEAKSLEYFPYVKSRWPHVEAVHSLGVRYQRGNEQFIDRTHFVVCGGRVYHVKIISTVEQAKRHDREITTIFGSFACRT